MFLSGECTYETLRDGHRDRVRTDDNVAESVDDDPLARSLVEGNELAAMHHRILRQHGHRSVCRCKAWQTVTATDSHSCCLQLCGIDSIHQQRLRRQQRAVLQRAWSLMMLHVSGTASLYSRAKARFPVRGAPKV